MIALAELCIEQELGVKSRHTVWKEHLYELEGFRRLLGVTVVERIVRRDETSDGETAEFPQVDIENAAEITRFVRDYIGYGRLNLFDSDSRELTARVDAFIPVNYMATMTASPNASPI